MSPAPVPAPYIACVCRYATGDACTPPEPPDLPSLTAPARHYRNTPVGAVRAATWIYDMPDVDFTLTAAWKSLTVKTLEAAIRTPGLSTSIQVYRLEDWTGVPRGEVIDGSCRAYVDAHDFAVGDGAKCVIIEGFDTDDELQDRQGKIRPRVEALEQLMAFKRGQYHTAWYSLVDDGCSGSSTPEYILLHEFADIQSMNEEWVRGISLEEWDLMMDNHLRRHERDAWLMCDGEGSRA